MGRSKGAAARRRKAAATRKTNTLTIAESAKDEKAPSPCRSLSPDLLANIHDRLGFLDRVAFAAVFASSCDDDDLFQPHAPWLVFPGNDPAETVQLFSIADRRGATVPAPEPALRGHVVVGSSRGWLATADVRGQIYLVNPATGEQRELPHLSTMGVFLPSTGYSHFTLINDDYLTIRYGHGPPFAEHWQRPHARTCSYAAHQMRMWFYRKVVLSSSPARPGNYAAMLITEWRNRALAFATAEDPVWRLAPSRDGVEDAIHHDGQFYSVSYTGVVEAWQRDAESGAYTSTAVAPRLAVEEHKEEDREPPCRKYLVMGPGGRLIVVIKYTEEIKCQYGGRGEWSCSFKVHVLGDDGQWKETSDIGDLALFVGVNTSLCVPTKGRPQIKAGCIYYTDDKLGLAELGIYACDLRAVGVYSLMDGTFNKIEAAPRFYRPPAWITPSIP